jgi:hypothetical protein
LKNSNNVFAEVGPNIWDFKARFGTGLGPSYGTGQLNIAPTGVLLFITIEHEVALFGRQFADQPPNVEPAAGVAVSVTVVPRTKLAVHPLPEVQLITAGLLTTVPFPKPTV